MAKSEPIEIEAPNADTAANVDSEAPPAAFLWRGRIHRITQARGPDRRLGAWWQGERAARDYWAVEESDGRRLWLCRDLATGHWFVHGLLAPESEAAA